MASGVRGDAEAQGLLGQALIQRAQARGEPSGGPTYEEIQRFNSG